MRWNIINMLAQAKNCLENRERDVGGYAYGIECLMENLEQVRDGKATWDEFAEFYCLTERDRPAPKSTGDTPNA